MVPTTNNTEVAAVDHRLDHFLGGVIGILVLIVAVLIVAVLRWQQELDDAQLPENIQNSR